ncbi:MAG: 30S ribosomal protein S7 [Anaerolineales bacterium]|uniref:Small ribosomal subunit protein uS7 n=1 Tax=Candidatus Desulfolinea nitratireducens TaxID=2841698 RepID=A0A8J6NHG8_9CHLR|nr:30S ribosomal protein S7 [Candidatus Desulfolinea nitratireducens]MBL6959806.1 30S ribosomal protein S7 [Anaerolineales bacterium]
MRRSRPEKRKLSPDLRYNSLRVQTVIHHVLKRGKKSTAIKLVYDTMDLLGENSGKEPLEVFETALTKVSPRMEVRPRRVGGATYQVPMDVTPERRLALAIRWLLGATRARKGKSFPENFAAELLDAYNETGAAIRKRDETHKMAEANRAFSHYRS